MSERFEKRRGALRKLLKAGGLDAVLVSNPTNVSYLTGFTGDSSAIFVSAKGRDLIVSDGRYETQLEEECPGVEAYIRGVDRTPTEAIGEVAAKLGEGKIGFEAGCMTVGEYEGIRSIAKGIEWAPTVGLVEPLRAVKDKEEIGAIREAIRVAEGAFGMLRAGLKLSETEVETSDNLENYLRRCGAREASFPPIIAAGPRAALPHARPDPGARVGDHPYLLVDWGAAVRPLPYKSDLTRVLVTGKVGTKFEKVYRTVAEAQRRAIAAIRPGIGAEEIDAEARSVIEEAGFGRFFSHGLGHGIGLDIHEAPRLRKGSPDVLRPGMVLTIEPGIYLPGWGGVRIEDDILVTPEGAEVLTGVPKGIDEIRVG
jgi:Xaa-Pro aminopeptidase